ncbi:MAG: tetratricopeptide repeat protein [Cyanobacteria bacterium SID2]|nr:tetratricopeptide repeat protein [Cyanobacteria bacterium SID2]MBP0006724.1 tetratricopeptide repeat protein [Cyanobacteria bacterium SBC]
MKRIIKTPIDRIALCLSAVCCLTVAEPAWSWNPSKYFQQLNADGISQELQQYDFYELADLCSNAPPLEAVEACSLAVQRQHCHESISIDREENCIILLDNLGAVLEQLGQYQDALTVLNYAAAIRPDDANIWYNLGVVFVELQQYEQAIEAFEEAARLDPSDTQARKQADLLRDLLR